MNPSYFFLQAKSDIRAPNVTGVQTSALPISEQAVKLVAIARASRPIATSFTACSAATPGSSRATSATLFSSLSWIRSEERRVGEVFRFWVALECVSIIVGDWLYFFVM